MSQRQAIAISEENYQKAYGAFRFGRPFTFQDLRAQADRDGIAYFLTYGLVNEALPIDGFDIVDTVTQEPVEWNDAFQELYRPLHDDINLGLGHQRLFGHSLLSIITDTPSGKPIFRSFDPDNFNILSDKFGNLLSVDAEEDVIGLADGEGKQDYTWKSTEELKNVYLSINKPANKRNQGKSYLNPIWDDINSVQTLTEITTVFVIRTGAGRIIITAPPSVLNNVDMKNSIIDSAKKNNSPDGVWFVPQGDPNNKVTVALETPTQGFDPVSLRQLPIQNISSYSGIPALRLEGAARNYSTAKENTASYLEALLQIQKENLDEILWIVERLAIQKLEQKEGIKGISLKFSVREELTEVERLEQDQMKWETLIMIMGNIDKVKIKLEDAQSMVGLEYTITEPTPEDTTDATFAQDNSGETEPDEESEDE